MSAHSRTLPPVVIVDDDIDHVVIMRTVLAMIAPAAEVTAVSDPRGATQRLLAAPGGALVLIDRILDNVESYPLVAGLAEARPDLAIAMLSAAMDDTDRDRALHAGALAAIDKPGSIDGWRELLLNLLHHAAARAADREGCGGAVA